LEVSGTEEKADDETPPASSAIDISSSVSPTLPEDDSSGISATFSRAMTFKTLSVDDKGKAKLVEVQEEGMEGDDMGEEVEEEAGEPEEEEDEEEVTGQIQYGAVLVPIAANTRTAGRGPAMSYVARTDVKPTPILTVVGLRPLALRSSSTGKIPLRVSGVS
jgi:hypothetical protein